MPKIVIDFNKELDFTDKEQLLKLCDEFMVMLNGRCIEMFSNYNDLKNSDWYRDDVIIRGAIYTNEGLIYVATIEVKEN